MKQTSSLVVVVLAILAFSQVGFTFYEVNLFDGGTDYIHWVVPEVSVYIDDVLTKDMSADSAVGAIVGSMSAWNELQCSHPILKSEGLVTGMPLYGGDNGNNIVAFLEGQAWEQDREEQFIDAIALTTLIYDPRSAMARSFVLEVNDSFEFSTDGAPGITDLQNTLTHEFGHVLALDHTSSDVDEWMEQTMFQSAFPGETKKRSLGDDDIDGVCTLYESIDLTGDVDPDGFPLEGSDAGCNATTHPATSTFTFFCLLAPAILLWSTRRRFSLRTVFH